MWNMKTNNEVQTLVYWCKHCNTPIIRTDEQDKKCPLCHKQIKKLTSDLRPVFPAEQALVELLTGESLMDASVWKGRIAYYVNGKPLKVSTKTMQDADIEYLKRKLKGAKYNYNN